MKLNIRDYSNGDIIRFLREYANLTQKELAGILKKDVRTIQRYEKGNIRIDLETIRSICELFDLSLTIESKSKKYNKKS